MLETLPMSPKERHIRGSYNLELDENKTWESRWIAQDEKGEWRSGKLRRIEAGERLPLHYYNSSIPTTFVPQEGGWAYIGINKDGKIIENYSTALFKNENGDLFDPAFQEEDEVEAKKDLAEYPKTAIKIEEGTIFTFMAYPYEGRVSIFRYSEPENALPIIREYNEDLPTGHRPQDLAKFKKLLNIVEDEDEKFYMKPLITSDMSSLFSRLSSYSSHQ